jgi:hypothetical protein
MRCWAPWLIPQRRHRLLGLVLLHEAEHAVGDHDDGDHRRLERHALGALQRPGHQRHHHRHQQQVGQRVGELGQQLAPGRHLGLWIQPVGTGPHQALGGLRRVET